MDEFKEKLTRIIVSAVGCDSDALKDDEDFFDGQLELDSIDMLEIVVAVKKGFNVELKPDPTEKRHSFRTLKQLGESIRSELEQG